MTRLAAAVFLLAAACNQPGYYWDGMHEYHLDTPDNTEYLRQYERSLLANDLILRDLERDELSPEMRESIALQRANIWAELRRIRKGVRRYL